MYFTTTIRENKFTLYVHKDRLVFLASDFFKAIGEDGDRYRYLRRLIAPEHLVSLDESERAAFKFEHADSDSPTFKYGFKHLLDYRGIPPFLDEPRFSAIRLELNAWIEDDVLPHVGPVQDLEPSALKGVFGEKTLYAHLYRGQYTFIATQLLAHLEVPTKIRYKVLHALPDSAIFTLTREEAKEFKHKATAHCTKRARHLKYLIPCATALRYFIPTKTEGDIVDTYEWIRDVVLPQEPNARQAVEPDTPRSIPYLEEFATGGSDPVASLPEKSVKIEGRDAYGEKVTETVRIPDWGEPSEPEEPLPHIGFGAWFFAKTFGGQLITAYNFQGRVVFEAMELLGSLGFDEGEIVADLRQGFGGTEIFRFTEEEAKAFGAKLPPGHPLPKVLITYEELKPYLKEEVNNLYQTWPAEVVEWVETEVAPALGVRLRLGSASVAPLQLEPEEPRESPEVEWKVVAKYAKTILEVIDMIRAETDPEVRQFILDKIGQYNPDFDLDFLY